MVVLSLWNNGNKNMKFKFSIRKILREIFDWGINEERICRDYRKEISKKIAHLNFSGKKEVLWKADQEFLKKLLNLDWPRNNNFMTHFDRFYLSSRLDCVDATIDEMKEVKRQQQIRKRKTNIKLVWKSNNS